MRSQPDIKVSQILMLLHNFKYLFLVDNRPKIFYTLYVASLWYGNSSMLTLI